MHIMGHIPVQFNLPVIAVRYRVDRDLVLLSSKMSQTHALPPLKTHYQLLS